MGMYDDIRCDAPLPDMGCPVTTRDFQTKDFDCVLDKFVITADGKLLHDGVRRRFHGMFNFYHYDTKIDTWWQYEAKFTDGCLVEITPVECRKRIAPYPNIKYHHYFPTTCGGQL
jgi:hypothetical protein